MRSKKKASTIRITTSTRRRSTSSPTAKRLSTWSDCSARRSGRPRGSTSAGSGADASAKRDSRSPRLQHRREQLVEPCVAFGHPRFHTAADVAVTTLDGLVHRCGANCGRLAVELLELERLERGRVGDGLEYECPDDPFR